MIMKQKLLMMMLALGMCSIGVNAQKREHKVEKDGFEWYEIADKDWHYGAENVNGGMIIPYGNYYIRYNSYNNLKHFLLSTKNTEGETEYGVYNIRGKEIIPLSRHYTWIIGLDSYYQVSTKTYSGICDKNGKEICKATGIKSVYAYYKSGRFYYEFSKNNLMGIMDGNGKIIVPAQWDAVWVEGNYIVGSKKGKEIKIKPISSITTKNNLLAVKEDMKDYTISPSSYASSSSSSSSGSNYDYVFEFNTFYLANTKVDEKATFSISKSGVIKVNYGGSPFEFKCKSIEVVEGGLLWPSHITFCGTDSDDKLKLSSTGIIYYDFLSTPISESVKKEFNDIMKKVKNKTIFSSPVPIREK